MLVFAFARMTIYICPLQNSYSRFDWRNICVSLLAHSSYKCTQLLRMERVNANIISFFFFYLLHTLVTFRFVFAKFTLGFKINPTQRLELTHSTCYSIYQFFHYSFFLIKLIIFNKFQYNQYFQLAINSVFGV